MSELFSSILIPGFFLLACILQLHYFHQPFMQLTDLEHVRPPGARLPRWAHRCVPGLCSRPPASAVPGGCSVPPPHCPGTEEGREGGQWVPTGGPRAERRPQLPPSNTAGGPGGCWGRRNGRGLWGQPQELG